MAVSWSSHRRISMSKLFALLVSGYLLLQGSLVVWNATTTTITTQLKNEERTVNHPFVFEPQNGSSTNAAIDTEDDDTDDEADTDDDNTQDNENDKNIHKEEDLDYFGEPVEVESDPSLVSRALEGLPQWVVDYVHWHRAMRTKYSGQALVSHPEAPPLLIRTCFGICGGLNDRLGQVPWDLYLANQTGRLLLVHWHRPAPLEYWLSPSILDWRVPTHLPGFFPPRGSSSSHNAVVVPLVEMRRARARIAPLFPPRMQPDKPTTEFWTRELDEALDAARAIATTMPTAMPSTHRAPPKIMRHRMLGHLHEHILEDRLRAAGETIPITTNDVFGRMFRLLFRPSPRLQAKLNALSLPKEEPYTAVHCRVRHPKVAKAWRPMGQGGEGTADKTGLVWEGKNRVFAIRIANHALQCTSLQHHPQPVYILADSSDLVHYYVDSLSNATYRIAHAQDLKSNPAEAEALQWTNSLNITSRPLREETVHLDLQKGRPVEAYDDTFLDFYTMVHARCLVFGIGNFAWFAAKVSGTNCTLLHQPEAWGEVIRKSQETPYCPI